MVLRTDAGLPFTLSQQYSSLTVGQREALESFQKRAMRCE